MSIQIKQIARLVILASAASLVGCEWITRVDTLGYGRDVAKDGKELFCKNGAGTGGRDCYTRRQLWDIQNQNPVRDPWAVMGFPPNTYPRGP
jgi:hypothetical protein